MLGVVTMPGLAGRFLAHKSEHLLKAHKRAFGMFEVASAIVVYAETFGVIHHLGVELIPSLVHPVAAAATLLALLAHLPVIEE